jgi:hypothetical protein
MEYNFNTTQFREGVFTCFDVEIDWFGIDWMEDYDNKPSPVTYMIIQGEYTESGKKHIQGYVEFNKKMSGKQVKDFFDCTSITFSKRRGTPKQASDYCNYEVNQDSKHGYFHQAKIFGEMRKQGSRGDLEYVRDLIVEGNTVDQLIDTSKENSVISNLLRYGDHFRNIQRRVLQQEIDTKLKLQYTDFQFNEMQQVVLNILSRPPDKRKIHWFYDQKGASGKSTLSEYLALNYKTFQPTGGKQADILYAHNYENIIIYDLARTQSDRLDHLYTTMELFKKGSYLSTKYECVQRRFETPHVIVFSNSLPDFHAFSEDRYDIYEVKKGKINKRYIVKNAEIFERKDEPPQISQELVKHIKHAIAADEVGEGDIGRRDLSNFQFPKSPSLLPYITSGNWKSDISNDRIDCLNDNCTAKLAMSESTGPDS